MRIASTDKTNNKYFYAIYNGKIIAKSQDVLQLMGIYYFPPKNVRKSNLEITEYTTPDSEKGRAHYYRLKSSKEEDEIAWQYTEPTKHYNHIKDHFAFYPTVEIRIDSYSKIDELYNKFKGKTAYFRQKFMNIFGKWIYYLLAITLSIIWIILIDLTLKLINIDISAPKQNILFFEISTDIIASLVFFLIIERSIKKSDEKNTDKTYQNSLILDAGSQSNSLAKRAIDALREKRWLSTNPILAGKKLRDTDWTKVNLSGANLKGCKLDRATLIETDFYEANLQYANIWKAILTKSTLQKANLKRCLADQANFSGADMTGANLQDSNLWGANLKGAIFNEDKRCFTSNTILPDGSKFDFDKTVAENLDKFTKIIHPNMYPLVNSVDIIIYLVKAIEPNKPIDMYVSPAKYDLNGLVDSPKLEDTLPKFGMGEKNILKP